MRDLRRMCAALLALGAVSAGCVSPSHHVSRMDNRRSPRVEACVAASLPVHDDHGPDQARQAFAVVTAECRESKEDDCRAQLRLGGCEVNADAIIDVSNRLVQGHRRMVGTAVEYLTDEPAVPSSGSSSTGSSSTGSSSTH